MRRCETVEDGERRWRTVKDGEGRWGTVERLEISLLCHATKLIIAPGRAYLTMCPV